MDQIDKEKQATTNMEIEDVEKADQPEPEKCSNKICPFQKTTVSFHEVFFMNKHRKFCNSCAFSIEKDWICIYCHTIFVESPVNKDKSEWVGCDNNNCGRWTHIECEVQKGIAEIKSFLNKSYKYICPTCRKLKTTSGKRESLKNAKIKSFEEVRRIMISKRKKDKLDYRYLYSESYKTIDKLLNNCNK